MGSDPESQAPSRDSKADERVRIGLPFEDALRGLLKVDPKALSDEPENGKPAKRRAKQPKK